ncbi:uncharacterized protein CXQ87_002806 [Candidozyma duobushaemuli]|uniref:Matrin-type domain-containing protein n=1 Tax=Candidozyma duobushaemuli TaxID=1231522 RepID=A0A2V1A9D6_9ASCO|nr:uncharacterized protein CXQ87_002806 [[Candida] duobushaemulonis]PVH14659.1 hypothetical protein CXQ87_002806 [[Candida] duobushaemulonis]
MPKYYCDYCKIYLTHDTMSVRKSHLQGKTHIKKYCAYYEEKAKQLGIWDLSENQYDIDLDYIYSRMPSRANFIKYKLRKEESERTGKPIEEDEPLCLPPPPVPAGETLPPSVLRYAEEDQKAIAVHMAREAPSL